VITIEDVGEGWVPGVSLLVEEACDLLDYLFPLIVSYLTFFNSPMNLNLLKSMTLMGGSSWVGPHVCFSTQDDKKRVLF
jgi:hypothetical protein